MFMPIRPPISRFPKRRLKKTALRKPTRRSSRSTNQTPDPNLNAIPTKAMLRAVALSKPPAISDEIPDHMPFDIEDE
jgi:hypothetical protein